ncbi:dipeptide ABC transporter ATP-binding protein [Mycetocola zhadangensis]|uniref:ABC transporter ATP-binding protein n=1 Tax=Mycetocola zhadangensis TaxID=1164595 RepID=A0A3L7IYT7_9MICO|nr:ABC transporter ATP-binding protein [Mycetocola zhadangensis]RLQ82641.1 ABC transporter ATP-binding protein [Mycetocola zhadangensis]GGE99561.1 ABC transporter ATP-binding protein [Mycetocola zhadangensis]
MTAPLIDVRGLSVDFGHKSHATTVVRDLSFEISRGECLALVGESGSGKSVTARSLVGLTGIGSTVRAERLAFDGTDTRNWSDASWRSTRGDRIGFVLQDALSSLDVLRTVGAEIGEPLKLHTTLSRRERTAKVLELLRRVGVPEPELRFGQFPHQLSGGLRQRALIASAIAAEPEFLIADEPTTALDASIASQILRLLETLKGSSTGMLVVSHDLSVVAQIADRIAVMQHGEIVEEGTTEAVLFDPQHPYTKSLIAAVPSPTSRRRRLSAVDATAAVAAPRLPRPDSGSALVVVENVSKSFVGADRVRRTVVDDVSFSVARGATLGIVGESGSGKTTTARILANLENPDSGSVSIDAVSWSSATPAERSRLRRQVQVVYQDPLSSFDPRFTVSRIIGEAVAASGRSSRSERAARVSELLGLVRLGPEHSDRRPIELSGGQRQRVAIARALAAKPTLLVLDEPVSALDVSVQAQVLDLLTDLQDELDLTYVFISHDLGVIFHISDEVLVMKDGRIVEAGAVDDVFSRPSHGYTRGLLDALPHFDSARA